jgi:exodeoxyribonuclease VII large subunit
LWPFNEEIVARAIFASKIPIVSGVGHEVDFTIADFVADQRAPTPSAAAELVAPNVSQYAREIEHLWSRLNSLMHYKLRHLIHALLNLRHRLRHPLQRLQQQAQRVDDLEQRLKIGISHLFQHKRAQLNHCIAQLQQHSPENCIATKLQQNTLFAAHLEFGVTQQLQKYQNRLGRIGQALAAINPLAVLNRGYAIVTKDAKVVFDINAVNVDDQVQVKLAQGQMKCQVLAKDIN